MAGHKCQHGTGSALSSLFPSPDVFQDVPGEFCAGPNGDMSLPGATGERSAGERARIRKAELDGKLSRQESEDRCRERACDAPARTRRSLCRQKGLCPQKEAMKERPGLGDRVLIRKT